MLFTAEEALERIDTLTTKRGEEEKKIATDRITKAVDNCEEKCLLGIRVSDATERWLKSLGYEVRRISDQRSGPNTEIKIVRDKKKEKMYQQKPTKTLNVTIQCLATYNSSINVPAHLTFDEAIQYAKEHIDEIPIVDGLDYVPGSDEIDIENCDFSE